MARSSISLDSEIGWQNASLLKELQKYHINENDDEPIRGVRVAYYNSSDPSESDHSDVHNEHWKKALIDKPRSLEVGTVTGFDFGEGVVSVFWDCGNKITYTYDRWKNLTVYSLGPAGYLGQMVFCDKCLDPSKGLAFRLARQNTSVGDLYDLCVQCYNEGDDEHIMSHFHCNIPSGNIDQDDDDVKKVSLPTREESSKYLLVGIFKHATVEAHSDCNSASSTGEVLSIVHEKGNHNLRKAKYYDSCAEVKLQDGSSLVYWEAGSGGKVELKAVKPGEAPFPVAIDHFIKFGDIILKEMYTYKTKLTKMNETVLSYCFMRNKPDGTCYSLTISGTELTQITDTEIWRRCKDLKIVILLMNELDSLPAKELLKYASTIELVCIQNNKFIAVPPIIYKLTNIKHLNLHGNQISTFPSELQSLKHLERLKFGHNNLYSLPDIFCGFKCLIEITFNNNFLTRLPPSFAELTRLECIDLTNNSFTCIPAPLLKLPNLKSIYMRFNRIHRLSPLEDIEGKNTRALLLKLVTLSLRGNPIYMRLKFLPGKTKALENVRANFLKLGQIPGQTTKALRVLVLGSCGAGKTSIVDALSFEKYVTPTSEMHHDHTVGIDRFSIPVKMKTIYTEDCIVELRLWDFAGERSYIMMNDLFITNGTLIWIAINFQRYECTPKSFKLYVANWLQQIMTKNVRPIVWIIGTHTDKCEPQDVQNKAEHIRSMIEDECKLFRKELKNELETLRTIEATSKYGNRSPKCVQKNIKHLNDVNENSVPCFVLHHLKVLHLTNTHTLSGFANLKDNLACFLDNESFAYLTLPLTVNQQKAADVLRYETEKLLSDGQAPILEKSRVLEFIRNELGQQSSDKEAASFLKYLHQSGHLLDCESNVVVYVIMDVDWLIDLLKQVFHHDFSAMVAEKKRRSAFNQLTDESIQRAIMIQKQSGVVEQPLLKALWPLNPNVFKDLVNLLQTYGLAYETTDPSGYLFPWLVTESSPNLVPPTLAAFESRIMVSYEFSPCLPICFLQQLAVRCKEGVSIKNVCTNSFIVYESKQLSPMEDEIATHTVLVSIKHEKQCGQIKLYATTDRSKDRSLMKELWFMVMQIVKKMETLLCNWTFYSKFQRKVCCPLCTVSLIDLQIQRQVGCLQQGRECYKCASKIPSGYIVPPAEYQINRFVDGQDPSSPSTPLLQRSTSIPLDAAVTADERRTHRSYSVPCPYGLKLLSIPDPEQHESPLHHASHSCPARRCPVLSQYHKQAAFNTHPTQLSDSIAPIQEEGDDLFRMEADRDAEPIQATPDFPQLSSDTSLAYAAVKKMVLLHSNHVHKAHVYTRRINRKDQLLLAYNSTDCDWKGLLANLGISHIPNIEKVILSRSDDGSGEPPLRNELIYQVLWEWMTKQGSRATVSGLATAVINSKKESFWDDAFALLFKSNR